jgi:hypothetical protein
MKVRKIHVRPGYLVADRHVWQASPGVTYRIVDEQPAALSTIAVSTSNTDNVQPDTGTQSTSTQVIDKQDTTTQDTVKQDGNKQDKEKQDRDKQEALLLKEIDETNKWARLGAQLYLGWFALQFIVNGLATGWLFNNRGVMPAFSNMAFFLLIGWNLMGIIGTLLILKSLLDSDLRIKEVIEKLTPQHLPDASDKQSRSPFPRRAISMAFTFGAVTLFITMAFWTILLIEQGRR